MSYFIHDLPGRIRVRTPVIKHNRMSAAAALALIETVRGVRSVRVSASTGSITIHYFSHVLCPSELINLLVRHGYLKGLIGFPRRLAPAPRSRSGR